MSPSFYRLFMPLSEADTCDFFPKLQYLGEGHMLKTSEKRTNKKNGRVAPSAVIRFPSLTSTVGAVQNNRLIRERHNTSRQPYGYITVCFQMLSAPTVCKAFCFCLPFPFPAPTTWSAQRPDRSAQPRVARGSQGDPWGRATLWERGRLKLTSKSSRLLRPGTFT